MVGVIVVYAICLKENPYDSSEYQSSLGTGTHHPRQPAEYLQYLV